MRIVAVDYGERRTGVAVSDELGITAQGQETIEVVDESELLRRVVCITEELKAEKVVIGLPLNMDGSESEKSGKVRKFGAELEKIIKTPVVFWDERMTSMQAKRVMREMEIKTRKNKLLIDKISATLILQEYLKTII
ncbi:Holliday junction resolvase RuvX [Candidatus Latescibacterota bacterium]